jgi:hypothetical protein
LAQQVLGVIGTERIENLRYRTMALIQEFHQIARQVSHGRNWMHLCDVLRSLRVEFARIGESSAK